MTKITTKMAARTGSARLVPAEGCANLKWARLGGRATDSFSLRAGVAGDESRGRASRIRGTVIRHVSEEPALWRVSGSASSKTLDFRQVIRREPRTRTCGGLARNVMKNQTLMFSYIRFRRDSSIEKPGPGSQIVKPKGENIIVKNCFVPRAWYFGASGHGRLVLLENEPKVRWSDSTKSLKITIPLQGTKTMKIFLMLTLSATLFAAGSSGPTLTATPQTVSVLQPVTFTLTAKTTKGYTYLLENMGTGQIMTQFNPSQTPDTVTIGISTSGTHQFCVDEVTNKGQNLGCIASTTVTVN